MQGDKVREGVKKSGGPVHNVLFFWRPLKTKQKKQFFDMDIKRSRMVSILLFLKKKNGSEGHIRRGRGRKLHSGLWKIPPRLLENPTQGFGKVLGHNSDLVIDLEK